MTPARVLIADSVEIFRAGVHDLLARETDFELREAASLDDVERVLEQTGADIVLIDFDLPPAGAVAAIAELAGKHDAAVVVWSFQPSPESVLTAVRAGASGFLDKAISPGGLVRALRGVLNGEAPLSRRLVTLMIAALHGLDEQARTREKAGLLSAREREVLELVAEGAGNREIAGVLTISQFTVKRHLQNILQKLGVPSRGAAASFYRAAFPREEARPVYDFQRRTA